VDEVSQAGDAGEGVVCLFEAADPDAKPFFDAEGEFECVEAIQAEAAANERLVIGNFIRLDYVDPEQVGDEML
jgi:hypothetical protein